MRPVDHLLLAGLRAREVERRDAGVDAEVGGALDGAQHLGRLEELLGRDAPAVQAGAADPALLDQGDVQPGRRSVERGRVAGRPSTEDHDVELLGQDGHLPEPAPSGAGQLSRADVAILPGRNPQPVIPESNVPRPAADLD